MTQRTSHRDYPKVQTLSVADLLNKAARAQFPSQHQASLLGFEAAKQKKNTTQQTLDMAPAP